VSIVCQQLHTDWIQHAIPEVNNNNIAAGIDIPDAHQVQPPEGEARGYVSCYNGWEIFET
jgi:hypothetical protein